MRTLRRSSRATFPCVIATMALVLVCVLGPSSQAVVIASGDGSGNTTAPLDDPGFDHVGALTGLSGVYVGNGWVLSARHVDEGQFVLNGTTYEPVPGSLTQLSGPGANPPDIMLIKINGDPGLPMLPLATSPPPLNADVILIGRGRQRDAPISFEGHDGWTTVLPFTKRWGTNEISFTSQLVGGVNQFGNTQTWSFGTDFDAPGETPHECQGVLGDSGGALFRKTGGTWYLSGLLWGTSVYAGQPEPQKTALEGNLTVAADVAHYRAQILAIIEVPSCSDGLDDDLDGLTDHPDDPGCSSPNDTSERAPELRCDDGIDNDGDGLIDHPADPECTTPLDPMEAIPVPAGASWSILTLAWGLCALGAVRLRRAPQSISRTL